MRRSGPDGRVYFDDCSVVYDLTIVSPTAPSYVAHGPDYALAQRVAEKNKLYSASVAAGGEEFVVAGATVFGDISAPLKALVLRAAAASNFEVDAGALLKNVAHDVCVLSGRVISSAERRAGVVHHRGTAAPSPAPAAAPARTPAATSSSAPTPVTAPARTPVAAAEPPMTPAAAPAAAPTPAAASHSEAPRAPRPTMALAPTPEEVSRPSSVHECRPLSSAPAEGPQPTSVFARASGGFAQAFASLPASAQSSRSSSVSSFGQSAFATTQGRPSTTPAFGQR